MTDLPPEVLAKHLESAMAKLRRPASERLHGGEVILCKDEAASVLAKLEAADRLARAVSDYNPGNYSIQRALSAYRTPQQEPSNG